jgi:hypothetical protein
MKSISEILAMKTLYLPKLEGNASEKKSPKIIIPSDEEDFIYVPSINLRVAKKRTHLGKDWNECHKLLQRFGERMLTLPEFVEFLKYVKIHHPNVYNEITEVRNPWRAEWLDADFKMKGKDLYVNFYLFDAGGNIIQKSELLDRNTLMEDKIPGISLEDYLNNNHTIQGLPNKEVKSGDLYYWRPRSDNNSVAGFVANSGRAGLYCYWYPPFVASALGVRAVRQA